MLLPRREKNAIFIKSITYSLLRVTRLTVYMHDNRRLAFSYMTFLIRIFNSLYTHFFFLFFFFLGLSYSTVFSAKGKTSTPPMPRFEFSKLVLLQQRAFSSPQVPKVVPCLGMFGEECEQKKTNRKRLLRSD